MTDARQWDEQWDVFAREFRVVRYDRRGYGRSPLPGGTHAPVRDLVEVMRNAGLESAAVVGNSAGASVALQAAVAEPSAVTALVLVDAILNREDWSDALVRAMDEEDELLDRGDVEAAVELMLAVWLAGPHRSLDAVDPGIAERIREQQRLAYEIQLDAFAREPEPSAERVDFAGRLGEITCPALVVVGDLDVPEAEGTARWLMEGIEGAQLVEIAGAAHLPSMERPDEFNRAVLEFLRASL